MNVETRMDLGCGWEPARAGAQPWSPASWASRGSDVSTCPGYTASLPEVVEVVGAYPHYEHGYLAEYLDGATPTPVALDCLAVFHYALEGHRGDVMRERAKGGT